MTRRRPLSDRLWPKVDRRGPDECWPFTGSRNEHGYGLIRGEDGKLVKAHRAAYELTHGPLPAGVVLRHSCDNPPCCNPAHGVPGTQADNVADMIARGRMHPTEKRRAVAVAAAPRGDAHWTRRLPERRNTSGLRRGSK